MFGKIKLVLLLLLAQAVSEKTEQPQLIFLTELIQSAHKQQAIETLLMLQHHQDENCSIQDWNPDGTPILRTNELNQIELRKNYNHQALALVCLQKTSHLILLLNALAKIFDHLRYGRVILWMQGNPTEDFLEEISSQVEEHKFTRMLVLGYHPNGGVSVHRLCPFPSPRFERIANFSSIEESTFYQNELNFQGKKAIVLANRHPILNLTTKLHTGIFLISRTEDRQIFEFALKYNLSLEMTEQQDSDGTNPHYDIQLNPRLLSTSELAGQIESAHTFTSSSLMVVVPCGKAKSITEVFYKLDLRTWFYYILSVYVIFVVVECVIVVTTYRISGHSYRLTGLNPFTNMRAFRAILGLPFPTAPRASVSLRQLFLAMSIFGMIFSNFFGCKLSSLLTKHPLEPQVENFEQLQGSGLTVIGDTIIQPIIEIEVNKEFFRRYLQHVEYMDTHERVRLIVGTNDSLAFIVLAEFWKIFDTFQQSIGRKTFCSSKNLSIIQNLPRMYVMEKDSIYRRQMYRFFMSFYESGIPAHWQRISPTIIRKYLNVTIEPKLKPAFEPLSLRHLMWLGWVLGCGYGLATLAFLVEIYMGKAKKKVARNVAPTPPGHRCCVNIR